MQLTKVQDKIVAFIRRYLLQHGYSPSIRDIMNHCGFKSPRAVSFHLEKLERAGLVRRDRKARSILLHDRDQLHMIPVYGTAPAASSESSDQPRQAAELAIHAAAFPGLGRRGGYAVRVRGDHMQQARIFDGDIAIVELRMPKPGDIVVISVGGETVLRRLAKQKERPGEELRVQGVVVGVYRKLG
jgi:repressor LexA